MTQANRQTHFNSYLINLDGSDARLSSARQQFEAHNIAFERISAVNGHKLSLETLDDYDAEKTERYMGRPMTGGEVGCVYSHIKALKAFLASEADYAIVFEDDFLLHDDFIDTIHGTLAWLKDTNTQWDLVNLSSPQRKYSRGRTLIGKSELRHAYYFPMLATAILWNRAGAEDFTAYHTKMLAPYDNILREWQSHRGKGLSLVPPIVSSNGSASDIDGANKPRHRYRKSTILYGIRKQRRSIVLKWRAMRHILLENKNTPAPLAIR